MFKEGCGCRVHNNHIRMKPHEIQPSTDVLTEKELKDVFNQLNHMVSSDTIRALLQTKTNLVFDTKQIQYLNDMRMNVLYDNEHQTPASKLLMYLERNPNIVYAYVTADVGNEKLISIRQRKKGKAPVTLDGNNGSLNNDESMGSFAERGNYTYMYTSTFTSTYTLTCTSMSFYNGAQIAY